jgi:hypothetical protein
MTIGRETARVAIALILATSFALRLSAVRFGLPSLYDPDEPLFMLLGLKLLTSGSLNPGWFGHPGSTTIYLLAAVDAAVASISILTGHFANVSQFMKGAYADPAILFVPARTAMVLLGIGAVWLTYDVTRRLYGTFAGLIAAGLLGINSLHVAWSAIIRTDIHASVFMLACLLFAIRAAQAGKLRDYVLAGLFAGFATATKWPAASVAVAIAGAAACGVMESSRPLAREAGRASAGAAALIAGVFIASPFIFIDWHTVLANVTGELKPSHLAHAGHGFLSNLFWYLKGPIGGSMGIPGLLLALAGAFGAVRHPIARWTILPAAIAFVALISGQGMVWSRWILPVLPMLTAFAAAALIAIADRVGASLAQRRRRIALAGLVLLAAVPAAATTAAQIRERANDTRIQAARWATAHIPAGSTVVLEHLELRLRDRPWKILFPVGDAGCLDARQLLQQNIGLDRVEKLRARSSIVDLGNVSSSKLKSCRADYAILTYFDLYVAERGAYPEQMHRYSTLLEGGRTVALFKPEAGRTGGPVVRIVAMPRH